MAQGVGQHGRREGGKGHKRATLEIIRCVMCDRLFRAFLPLFPHLLTFKCYRFRIRHFWQDVFRPKFLNGSLEPVLAGFGIKVALG